MPSLCPSCIPQIRSELGNSNPAVSGPAKAACDFDICAIDSHRDPCGSSLSSTNNVKGWASQTLNADKLPTLTTTSQVTTRGFDYWYRPHKFNRQIKTNITLTRNGGSERVPSYSFFKKADFHPLQGVIGTFECTKAGTSGCKGRNYVFGSHFTTNMVYNAEAFAGKIKITSDDDSLLYIDNKLIIDYGGLRAPTELVFNIPTNPLLDGKIVPVSFFHADRCPSQSSFGIWGPLTCETTLKDNDTDGDGVPDCLDFCPEDEWKVEEDKNCPCGKTDCLTCAHFFSEAVCTKASGTPSLGLACDWCSKPGGGYCAPATTCPCTDLRPEQCPNYNTGTPPRTCSVCKTSASAGAAAGCANIELCECESRKTHEQCSDKTNKNFRCLWCGDKCINANVGTGQCPECGSFSGQKDCLEVEEIVSGNSVQKCVWCNENASNGGFCARDCPCSAYDSADGSKNDVCDYVFTQKDIAVKGNPECEACVPGKDDTPKDMTSVCLKKGETCNRCPMFGKDECSKNAACKWCGNFCTGHEECPSCSIHASNPERCAQAVDGEGKQCQVCSDGVCANNCPTCKQINDEYVGTSMAELRQRCISSLHNPCVFCGMLEFNLRLVNDTDPVPPRPDLCVAEASNCPACSFVHKYRVQEEDAEELGKNCHALRHEYSSRPKMPADDNKQLCVHCKYTDTCNTFTPEQIAEYDALKDFEAKVLYANTTFCDTSCSQFTVREGCFASMNKCAWCFDTDGNEVCNDEKTECASCKLLDNPLVCAATGCKWCSNTNTCISGNRDCYPTAVIAASISAGVVAAIVIAAVVAVVIASIASKKVYDSIIEARANQMDAASANPIFEEKEAGGSNPTFQA